MDEDIQAALEAAASSRVKVGCDMGDPRVPTDGDVRAVRRVIGLFLESLDPELTVSELRHHLT